MTNTTSIPFRGKITDSNDLSPAYGGKAFRYEITTASGEKVYILSADQYLDMVPMRRTPIGRAFSETDGDVGNEIAGEYVEWLGMKVVVTITEP